MTINISLKNLRTVTLSTVALWILVQIVLVVVYWDIMQGIDQCRYMYYALDCYQSGTTYPSIKNLYDQYLQAPGMVNFLMLQHILFGTTTFNVGKIINILLNLGIVFNIYYLAKRFFSLYTAYTTVIIYCLLPTNWFAPIWLYSELPYLCLTLTGFSLSLNKKGWMIIIASFLFGIAHTFRPLVLAFLLTSVGYYWLEKRRVYDYVFVVIPYLMVLWCVGTHNKSNTGYFVTSSTTGGYNLIMSANDRALARPEFNIFDDSTNIAYIPNRKMMTFAEKDSIYKARAIHWIAEHPIRYLALYVEKVGRLWSGDVWSIPKFSQWDDYDYISTLPNPSRRLLIRRVIQAIEGLPYYVVLMLFFWSLFKCRSDIFSQKGLFLFILLLGTAGTCLFTVELRFHYPYLFCIVLWAAYGLFHQREHSAVH